MFENIKGKRLLVIGSQSSDINIVNAAMIWEPVDGNTGYVGNPGFWLRPKCLKRLGNRSMKLRSDRDYQKQEKIQGSVHQIWCSDCKGL